MVDRLHLNDHHNAHHKGTGIAYYKWSIYVPLPDPESPLELSTRKAGSSVQEDTKVSLISDIVQDFTWKLQAGRITSACKFHFTARATQTGQI